jgi:hypothetical protein
VVKDIMNILQKQSECEGRDKENEEKTYRNRKKK